MEITINGTSLPIQSFGAQSIFKYGQLIEINVTTEYHIFNAGFDFNTLLIIKGDEHLFSQQNKRILKISNGEVVSIEKEIFPPDDESRIAKLLTLLGYAPSSDNMGQILAIKFGVTETAKNCDWCLTDRSCLLTFCGSSCSWSNYECQS